MAKKIEQRGFNIGIRHYLNTKLKPQFDYTGRELSDFSKQFRSSCFSSDQVRDAYPLYVQIVFKGQNIRIRSVLGSYVSAQNFENYLEKHATDVEKERSILRSMVIDQFCRDSDFQLNWGGVTSTDTVYEFNKLINKELTSRVSDLLQELVKDKMIPLNQIRQRAWFNHLPERKLTESESKELEEQSFIYEEDHALVAVGMMMSDRIPMNNTDDANFMSLFFSLYIEEFKELRNMFKSEFWDLDSYVRKIKEEYDIRLITVDDWFSGEFDRLFMKVWNDKNALKAIHEGFDTLRETSHYALQAFLDIHDPSVKPSF